MRYDHQSIEKKWQARWDAEGMGRAREDSGRRKFFALIEFPYPSGEGLHIGHLRSNTAMDIIARKRRMEGYEVLYPIGWDAFGLPAENYALKTGKHPRVATEENCANFRRQLKAMGFSFDWSREVNTTDPAYYKWTQWIFLQLLKHGLAYKAKMPINWCPSCKIGLANEEAIGGVCERCGGPIEKRDKEQWMLKITAYADKLLAGLETVDYIERAKVQQVNWIGKSEGATITFALRGIPGQADGKHTVAVFTTRPDTLFGATFLVVSPELAKKWMDVGWQASDTVRSYVATAVQGREQDRLNAEREKTGVDSGIRAVNPANDEEIPVWIADFVLGHYGTGAVFADAHDERDFAFAKKYGIRLKATLQPSNTDDDIRIRNLEVCFSGKGILYDSAEFSGLTSDEAIPRMTAKFGRAVTTYKLRDWVFSRQRYWGEPIPVVFCTACAEKTGSTKHQAPNSKQAPSTKFQTVNVDGVGYAVVPIPEEQLPVELPNVEKYQPTDTGDSPLAAMTEWVNTTCPQCGGPAKRETDVMPNWAGSSWYFLAYAMHQSLFPQSGVRGQWSDVPLKYWMPIDWYNGGMEHTTLHLLYSRFWNIFLHDIGVVPVAEPYAKRTSHGLILASDGEKMSKSRGNVVNPDEIVAKFGADAVRVYEMFIGPFDQPVPWSTDGLVGCRRFLDKVVALAERVDPRPVDGSCVIGDRDLHRTIKKVTEDIEAMRFNTAVSALMEYTNALGKQERIPFFVYVTFLALLSPFAPHLAEELHERIEPHDSRLTTHDSIFSHPWPAYDSSLVVENEIDLVIQVNGKVRATIRVPADIGEADARARALVEPHVVKYLEGKPPQRVIFVPGRLMNLVV